MILQSHLLSCPPQTALEFNKRISVFTKSGIYYVCRDPVISLTHLVLCGWVGITSTQNFQPQNEWIACGLETLNILS